MKRLTLLATMCLAVVIAMAQNYSKIAMVGNLIGEGDDDELAAIAWFESQGGTYYDVSAIQDGTLNLDDFNALWISMDNQQANSFESLRAGQLSPFIQADVLNKIKTFYEGGGNLLITNHAAPYLKDLGRVDMDPNIADWGAGGDNPDMWDISATYGTYSGGNPHQVYDKSNDPIFADLAYNMVGRQNGTEYKKFPLLGGTYKENHNCFWEMNLPGASKANGEDWQLTTFQDTYTADALSTWGHVEDYCGAGIIRWKATPDFKGVAISISLGAYEWNLNSGANEYQDNIIQLTKNALKELSLSNKGTSGGEDNESPNINYSKVLMIGGANASDYTTTADDDEQAAIAWFTSKGGQYVGAGELGNVTLADYSAVWVHIDRNNDNGLVDLRNSIKDALTSYYQGGGNLLLTNHASFLLKDVERIGMEPDENAYGDGSNNVDIWYVSPTHGTAGGLQVYDNSNDPIYAGLTSSNKIRENGNTYKIFPLIGSGHKEDHNSFWKVAEDGNYGAYQAFVADNNVDILGTWTHIENYRGAAIARWKPTDTHLGTAITIGVAAYEWNQNSGVNPYQSNIIRMTENALAELTNTFVQNEQELIFTGAWSQEAFEAADNALVTSIDLTGITSGLTEKPQTANPNCLIFVAPGSPLAGEDNVVAGIDASSIVLQDKAPFKSPKAFYTESISYTRDFSATGWASFILPFDTDNLQGETIEEFQSCDGTVATFSKVSSIQANTPYIIQVATSGSKTFSAAAAQEGQPLEIGKTIINNVVKGDYTFKATFTNIPAGYAEGLFVLKGDGSGYAPASANASIPAFRSYIEYTGQAQSGQSARQLSVVHDKDGATDLNPETAVSTLQVWSENGSLKVYSPSAQAITLVAIDGRVIARVALNEGVNTIDNLARGMYLVNGIKVIL